MELVPACERPIPWAGLRDGSLDRNKHSKPQDRDIGLPHRIRRAFRAERRPRFITLDTKGKGVQSQSYEIHVPCLEENGNHPLEKMFVG